MNGRRTGVFLALAAFVICGSAAGAQPARLHAGAAKVDITPADPVALCGYSYPETRISEGIHDRLYARAIAFRHGSKKLVLVSCDLSGFQTVSSYYFEKEILGRFRLEPEELLLCGTHTHSAPFLFLSKNYPHPNNYTYTEGLRAKLAQAVGQALRSAGPARLAIGIGHSDVAVNRRVPMPAESVSPGGSRVKMGRNPDGPVDRSVLVLKIERSSGSPIGSLFEYGCHSRSLTAANKLVSGDIFGIAGQYVEKALDRSMVNAAFAGPSGDIDPWHVGAGFDETVRMGTALGAEVIRALAGAREAGLAGGIRSATERLAVPGKAAGTPTTGKANAPVKHVRITVAAVGEVAFVGLDCEALVDVGKAIRAKSPFPRTFILTNCNGGSGYLPPAHLYPERGYEVDLSGFGPEAAGMVADRVGQMLASLRK